jgi:KEOPS complex subunit Pcc1|tara:strand:- start:43 stop:291 length:249 start_codon:yes stop_codon:yes gene_type:complete
MTLNFSAKIELTAEEKTRAIFDSITIDNKFYPENPTKTKISFNKKIIIEVEAKQIPQLRANLNSTLRLMQASIDSINSAVNI